MARARAGQIEPQAERTLLHGGYRFRCRWIPCERPSLPPVVFLGGAFQSMESWSRFVEAFAPSADVLLVDLPGGVGADALPSRFGLDFLAGALATALGAVDAAPAYVVGASYGAPIGYRFAQLFPERVSHLVLAGATPSIPLHAREVVWRTLGLARRAQLEPFAELALEQLSCSDPARPIARREVSRRLLRRGIRAMGRGALDRYVLNTRRLLDHPPLDLDAPPRCPTLVFTGEHDTFTTPAACRALAARLPAARFTTLPEADHLFHLQQPAATIALLERFAISAGVGIADLS